MVEELIAQTVGLGATPEGAKEYVDFCLGRQADGDGYQEKHHILMRSTHPELKHEPWNIVFLDFSNHVRAHLLLHKVTQHPKALNAVAFTFNMSVSEARAKALEGFTEGEIAHLTELRQSWVERPRTPEHCKRISIGHKNSLVRVERGRKISAALKGKPKSAEARANMSAAHKGVKLSPEHREAMSVASHNSSKHKEQLAKLNASKIGRHLSPETREKISAAQRGKSKPALSAEHRARLIAINTGRVCTPETRTKISAAQKGKTVSVERRKKISATLQGRKNGSPTAETRVKISEALRNSPRFAAYLRSKNAEFVKQ